MSSAPFPYAPESVDALLHQAERLVDDLQDTPLPTSLASAPALPPTHARRVGAGTTWIDPFEVLPLFCVSRDLWQDAKTLADRIAATSRSRRPTSGDIGASTSATMGKLGELLYDRFAEYTFALPFDSYVRQTRRGTAGDAVHAGLTVDVKTRHLQRDDKVHMTFEVMIPVREAGEVPACDLYVVVAYCMRSRHGYVLGWVTGAESADYPMTDDLRYPAYRVPFGALHPIETLEPWLIAGGAGE